MATGQVTGMQEVNKTERFLVGQYKNRHICTDATFNLSDLLIPCQSQFKVTDLTDFDVCVFLLIIIQF